MEAKKLEELTDEELKAVKGGQHKLSVGVETVAKLKLDIKREASLARVHA